MKKLLLLLVLLSCAVGAVAQCGSSTNITCVQTVLTPYVSGVPHIPTVTLPAVAAGHVVVVLLWSEVSDSVTPVSALGNVYNSCGAFTNNYNPWNFYWSCWYTNSSAAGTETVTLGTTTSSTLIVEGIELNTGGKTLVGDKNGFNHQNNTTAITATTASVTGTDELVIGEIALNSSSAITWTPGAGFTSNGSYYNSGRAVEYLTEWLENTSATGGMTCNATQSAASSALTENLCFTFKLGTAAVALPTISPTAGTYFASPTVTLTDSTSGATIFFTTDGTTPTHSGASPTGTTQTYSSGFVVSATTTIKALGYSSGMVDSGVVSSLYSVALPIATLASDSMGSWFDANKLYGYSSGNVPYQFPLDAYWTQASLTGTNVASWTANGPLFAYPALDQIANSYGFIGPGSGWGYATRTGETFSNNQFSQSSYHGSPTSAMAIGVRCGNSPGSLTGDILQITPSSFLLQECNAGSCTTLISDVITLAAEGDVYNLSIYGTSLQVTRNGAAIPGMNLTYTSALTGGSPCLGASSHTTLFPYSYAPGAAASLGTYVIGNSSTTGLFAEAQVTTAGNVTGTAPAFSSTIGGSVSDGTAVWTTRSLAIGTSSSAVGYNWSAGDLGITSPPIIPIAYVPPAVTNYNLGGNSPTWPAGWPWLPNSLFTQGPNAAGPVCCNFNNALNGQYAVGSNSGTSISQSEYEVPVTDNQWIHAYIAMDSTAWNNRNWFLKLQSTPTVPPTAYPPAISGCYDAGAIYIGDEPMYQMVSACGGSLEYCGTNFLHVTYANNATSTPYPLNGCTGKANYNIWTGFGTGYSPMHGDEILAIFESSVLTVYCKSGATLGGWPGASITTVVEVPAYSAGVSGTVIEVNGLYQLSSSIPGTASTYYALNTLITDPLGHWQKVITAGTTASGWPPTWNDSGGTTSSGSAIFSDQGPKGTATTGLMAPTQWGEAATNASNGAITVDGTTMWTYVGESCPTSSTFSQVGQAFLSGFSGGFPGIWAANYNSSEYVFQDIRLGSGNPCGATYSCTNSTAKPKAVWVQ